MIDADDERAGAADPVDDRRSRPLAHPRDPARAPGAQRASLSSSLSLTDSEQNAALTLLHVPLQVLNLVRISPAVSRVEVGQAIPATLTIQPTFHWSRAELGESHERDIKLVWTVVANQGEWVVGGQARGEFVAQVRPASLVLSACRRVD